MQDRLGRSYEDYLLGNDNDGYSFTEEGQDIFNGILDHVEYIFRTNGLVHEDRG
jgi:hypothetical protein